MKSQGLQISNCCKAEMKIVGGDEGTMFYQCLGCSHGCDPHTREPKPKKGWEEEFDKYFKYWNKSIIQWDTNKDTVKQFISSLLSQARKDTIEEIENRVDALITGEFKDKYLPWLALKDFLDQLIKK